MRALCLSCCTVHNAVEKCPNCLGAIAQRSERERVLLDGAELTGGDRNRTYGAPAPNLALQMQLWELYQDVAQDKHSDAHDAAMQHVFAKIARIASGKRGHRDNYVDAATYIAIAFECDATEDEGKQQ